MKKAIVFLMVLGAFLTSVAASEVASTNVGFSFVDGGISKQNFIFTQDVSTVTTSSGAASAQDGGDITIATSSLDGTAASTVFYFVWYFYSTQGLDVTLKVGAMQTSDRSTVIEDWDVLPEKSNGNIENTASYSNIDAPSTAGDTTSNKVIVTVAKPNVMTENWGVIKLTGTVDLDGVAPGIYSSEITADITVK